MANASSWPTRVRGLFGPRTINVQPPAITVSAPQREPEDLLEASLEVAQTQLLAQLAEETSIDGQTIGIVAFLGALLAVDVAAKDILGRWWWTPLVVVGVAVLPCLGSLYAAAPVLGPRGFEFYRTYGGHPSRLAREQLLADLDAAFGKNASRAKAKRLRLRGALGVTVVGLVVAALLITLDTPTTMKDDGNKGQSTAASVRHRNSGSPSARAHSGAGAIAPALGYSLRLVLPPR